MGIPRIVVRDFDLDGYRIPAGTLLTISRAPRLCAIHRSIPIRTTSTSSARTIPDGIRFSARVRIAASVRHSPASRWRKSSRQLHGWRRARGWLVLFRDLRLDPYDRLTGWRSNFWADSNVRSGVLAEKNAKTLNRDRRNYSSKTTLVAQLASQFNLEVELKNIILVAFDFLSFYTPGVKNGSRGLATGCLLCPGERTSSGCPGMSEKCSQKRTL